MCVLCCKYVCDVVVRNVYVYLLGVVKLCGMGGVGGRETWRILESVVVGLSFRSN